LYNGDVKDAQYIAAIQQSFIYYHGYSLQLAFTEITVLNQALEKLDEKDDLNSKLLQQRMLNDKQIKILNKIEAAGDKNYAKYNKEIYEPYVIKGLVRDFENRPKEKRFSYPHYIPRKFFVTADDIMPNLKKKYWHGPRGTRLPNEITEDELNKMAEVVTNISNQTQEPDAVMSAYLKDVPNNKYGNTVNKIIREVTSTELNNMIDQNIEKENANDST
jgi:hypothetical protein